MLKPLSAALFALCLAAPAYAGHGDDHDDLPPPEHRAEFCKNNPVTCEVAEERRAAREKWCADNAGKCEALKKEREARHARMKEKCAADPAKCEARKGEFREKMKERRERRREDAPAQ